MPLPPLDVETLRFLEYHEARVHALPGRDLRDLGDAILLVDPIDPEPFWNRIAGIRWPANPAAFERRLDEAITLFATLGRRPHVWPRPALNEPVDLADRLRWAGFDDLGHGMVMMLAHPDRLTTSVDRRRVSVERIGGSHRAAHVAAAAEIALVLSEAFGVEEERRASIEIETLAMFEHPGLQAYLVRVDDQPAAVAKRSTFEGATYLSSIGTRPAFRGQGLGALATVEAARDALEAGSRWTYLGVFEENVVARRMYERLGFLQVGGPTPDLLLQR